jgi:O-antigen/teichoic acid export membrane protein
VSGAKGKAARGAAWATGANVGCQLLALLFSFALARILSPRVFGLVALAWIYTAFMQIFVTQGFGLAIIQRKELEEEHLNSAFWIAIGTAVLFCLASNLLAAPIAHLFKEPNLAPVICWLSLLMIFSALGSVPTAILTRDLEFRPLAIRGFASTGIGGAIGVAMAIGGCGVWSLVGQQLIGSALGCACLWFAVPWRPRFQISRRHVRDLYGFSVNIAANDILWFFSKRSDQTMVGYGFGPEGLGPYSLASKIITFLNDGIVGPLQSVALPALSKLQSDPEEFERAVCRYCEISSFLVFPLFAGIAAVAPELVPLFYGKKWMAAVPLLQVLALYGAALTAFSFTFPALVAKGRTGLQLVTSTILSCVTVAGCMLGSRFTPKAVAFSLIASYALFGVSFLLVMNRILQIRPIPLIKKLVYPAFSSLFMLTAVAFLRTQLMGRVASVITLCICIVSGVIVYVGTACLLRRDLIKTVQEAFGSILFRAEQIADPPAMRELEEDLAAVSSGSSDL